MHQTTQQQNKVLPLRTARGGHLSPTASPEALQKALQRLLNKHPKYIVMHLYTADRSIYAVLGPPPCYEECKGSIAKLRALFNGLGMLFARDDEET